MGNTKSSSTSTGILRRRKDASSKPSLAMMAAARKVYLKKVHIMMLRFSMAKLADEYGMIQREGFDEALSNANLNEFEIFDLMFTVWDNAESRKVSYREFCMGLSPLACPMDNVAGVLQFALRVNDEANRKQHIEWKEVYELLTGINSTASYFGDPALTLDEIDEIVETVFQDKDQISHEECIKLLSINPYVLRFASGKARSKVSFRDVLETQYIFDKEKLVTEYIVDCIDELALRTIHNGSNDSEENSSSFDKYTARDKYTSNNNSNESRDKYTTNNNSNDTSQLVEARYSLAPKKLFDNNNNMADNDYYNSQEECDENSGIAGNSQARRDPPTSTKKYGRRGSFSNLTGFSPSINTMKTIGGSRDPP